MNDAPLMYKRDWRRTETEPPAIKAYIDTREGAVQELMPDALADDGGEVWLQAVKPHRKRPLQVIEIRCLKPQVLSRFNRSNRNLRAMEEIQQAFAQQDDPLS